MVAFLKASPTVHVLMGVANRWMKVDSVATFKYPQNGYGNPDELLGGFFLLSCVIERAMGYQGSQ